MIITTVTLKKITWNIFEVKYSVQGEKQTPTLFITLIQTDDVIKNINY